MNKLKLREPKLNNPNYKLLLNNQLTNNQSTNNQPKQGNGKQTNSKQTNNNQDNKIFLPNEIFQDLQDSITSPNHCAFAYGYYYLISYLYRYCKYMGEIKFTQEDIKEYLGYSRINMRVNYIIKQGGVLDKMKYTKTTSNFPMRWDLDDNNLNFFMYSDLNSEFKRLDPIRNFKIKFPIKAFYRTEEDLEKDSLTGTFYNIKNTHEINIEEFIELILQVGVIGFYVYGYLKCMAGLHGGKYGTKFENLCSGLKLSEVTVKKYLKILENKKFIKIDRFKYSKALKARRASNRYSIITKL